VIARYPALRALVELALACAALVGGGVSWAHARHTVRVAPIAEGQPFTTSLVYDPQQLLLSLVLVTIAGVLAVVGIARLRRRRRRSANAPVDQEARPSS
jgi:NO-binding membrane sensor protein with MHYT domain